MFHFSSTNSAPAVTDPFSLHDALPISGSMIPTLLIGDFILVNKYAYGVRLPVLNLKIADVDLPRRGDVMVFRFPNRKSTRLNSSHGYISYAVFCSKKKNGFHSRLTTPY